MDSRAGDDTNKQRMVNMKRKKFCLFFGLMVTIMRGCTFPSLNGVEPSPPASAEARGFNFEFISAYAEAQVSFNVGMARYELRARPGVSQRLNLGNARLKNVRVAVIVNGGDQHLFTWQEFIVTTRDGVRIEVRPSGWGGGWGQGFFAHYEYFPVIP